MGFVHVKTTADMIPLGCYWVDEADTVFWPGEVVVASVTAPNSIYWKYGSQMVFLDTADTKRYSIQGGYSVDPGCVYWGVLKAGETRRFGTDLLGPDSTGYLSHTASVKPFEVASWQNKYAQFWAPWDGVFRTPFGDAIPVTLTNRRASLSVVTSSYQTLAPLDLIDFQAFTNPDGYFTEDTKAWVVHWPGTYRISFHCTLYSETAASGSRLQLGVHIVTGMGTNPVYVYRLQDIERDNYGTEFLTTRENVACSYTTFLPYGAKVSVQNDSAVDVTVDEAMLTLTQLSPYRSSDAAF